VSVSRASVFAIVGMDQFGEFEILHRPAADHGGERAPAQKGNDPDARAELTRPQSRDVAAGARRPLTRWTGLSAATVTLVAVAFALGRSSQGNDPGGHSEPAHDAIARRGRSHRPSHIGRGGESIRPHQADVDRRLQPVAVRSVTGTLPPVGRPSGATPVGGDSEGPFLYLGR